jgi:hypothetical protein
VFSKYYSEFIVHCFNFGHLNKRQFAPLFEIPATISGDGDASDAKHYFLGVDIAPLENLNQLLQDHLCEEHDATWDPAGIA